MIRSVTLPATLDLRALRPGTRVHVDPGRGRVSDLSYSAEITARRSDGRYQGRQLSNTPMGLASHQVGQIVVFGPDEITVVLPPLELLPAALDRALQALTEWAFDPHGGRPLGVVGAGDCCGGTGLEVLVHGPLAPVRRAVASLGLGVSVRVVASGPIVPF